jgi:dolichol-phosphate mannosyltransferase
MEKHEQVKNAEISIVVPIWNDAEAIDPFLFNLKANLKGVEDNYEVIFVADPSQDHTVEKIEEIVSSDLKVKGIFMASRAGQPASTLAGISAASGSAVIVTDVDLQDPTELIPEMIGKWRQGSKLIIPRRRSRTGEPLTKKLTATLGYAFLSKYGHTNIPKNTGDFRLMDRSIVDRLLQLPETHIFLRGMVALVSSNPEFIEFDRPGRPIGKTKYNKWFGGIRSGLNGIVSFSSALLDFIMVTGVVLALFAFFLGAKMIIYKIAGGYVPSGSAQLFAMVTFVGGMQLIAIGVVGLYVGRIFEETKNRPRWMIERTLGFVNSSNKPNGEKQK